MPTLSACMIVRNEEELILQCFASIKDLVDEIIIVDTGSTDNTIEMIKQFEKVKLFHYEWNDDFSAARNVSIAQATGDWLLIIDADEHLVDRDVLKKAIESGEGNAFVVDIINKYKNGKVETHLPSLRVFKRELNLRYTNRVHNQLVVGPDLNQIKIPVKIWHYGYDLSPEKMAAKTERTGTILRETLEKDPYDAGAMFNLAQLMRTKDNNFNISKVDEIIELCSNAARISNPRNQKWWPTYVHSTTLGGWANLYKGNLKEALRLAMEAIRYKANYLDALLLAGYVHAALRHWKEGEHWFNTYLRVKDTYNYQDETDDIICSYFNQQADCYVMMGSCAEKMEDEDKAINLYFASLRADPTKRQAYNAMAVLNIAGKLKGAEWAKVEEMYEEPEPMDASYYDEIYSKPYKTDHCKGIYTKIVELCKEIGEPVLEVGCGTGDLAAMLVKAEIPYFGFDFSDKAIEVAKTKSDATIAKADAYDPVSYNHTRAYGVVVMTELLEHVDDKKVLGLIPKGKRVIASVPNFSDPVHLRIYGSPEDISQRFVDLLKIDTIQTYNLGPSNIIYVINGVKI